MGTPYRGACPSCAAEVVLAAPPVAKATCAACGRPFLVLVPGSGAAGEGRVRLVAVEGASGSAALPRPLTRLVRLALLAGGALATAFVVTLALVLLDAGEGSGSLSAGVFRAMLDLALVASLGTGLLWLLLGAGGRADAAFDPARSALALGAGYACMAAASWTFGLLRPEEPQGASTQALAVATLVVGGLLAGWCAARLATLAPLKHALALGVAAALAPACLALGAGPAAILAMIPVGAASFVPPVLAGAWLQVRLGR